MNVNTSVLLGFQLLSLFAEFAEGSSCYILYYYYNYYHGRSMSSYILDKYCAFGCCGSFSNRYCCPAVGPIIGIVIAILVIIGITIMVILCCRRRRATPGFVMQPSQAVNYQSPGMVVIQSSGIQTGIMYPQTTVVGGYAFVGQQMTPPSYQPQNLNPTPPMLPPSYPGTDDNVQQK